MIIVIILTTAAFVSFLLFLILYRRLKTSPFWVRTTPGEFWASTHTYVGIGGLVVTVRYWVKGAEVTFLPLMMIVVYITTGVIMMHLANKLAKVRRDQDVFKKISEQLEKDSEIYSTEGDNKH